MNLKAMVSTPTFDLVPAEPTDVPRLAHIHVSACLPDHAFKLYFTNPQDFQDRVVEMLHGQIGAPNWKHVKAVNRNSGAIAAWASWLTPTDAQIRERDERVATAAAAAAAASIVDPTTTTTNKHDQKAAKGEFNYPPGLSTYVKEDTERWLAKWTCERRHMLCRGMFTEPSFQGQGMGSALVAYGNRLADEAGLPIFLHASAYGYPIYAKHGFETVQHLDVDLRMWAPGAEQGDRGYGNYRFRYMVRLPRTLPRAL